MDSIVFSEYISVNDSSIFLYNVARSAMQTPPQKKWIIADSKNILIVYFYLLQLFLSSLIEFQEVTKKTSAGLVNFHAAFVI